MSGIAPLCLTMGEPAGIGGDLTLAAWHGRHALDLPAFFVIDDPARLRALAARLGLDVPIAEIASPAEAEARFATALPVLPLSAPVVAESGRPDPETAPLVIESLTRAWTLVSAGEAAAMVTNPIQKSALYAAGFPYPGHTEFLEAMAGGGTAVMMLVIDGLRVVPVSVHESLRAALTRLNTDSIVAKARIAAEALRDRFGIAMPRLAVAGINPHAGERGTLGREEIEIVEPAIARLRAEGWQVAGPYPPDSMFHAAARAGYDVAICHYHDQALIPLKTLDYANGVNVTLGLPIVRTSPDHGTALDIAGTGTADPSSLIAAIRLAAKLA